MKRIFMCVCIAYFSSCSSHKQFAKIEIFTNNPKEGSVSVNIRDAKSGLDIGDGTTPILNFILTKKSNEKNPTLSLIVFDKCYPTKWKLVEITKWVENFSDIKDANYINKIDITVIKDTTCNWEN